MKTNNQRITYCIKVGLHKSLIDAGFTPDGGRRYVRCIKYRIRRRLEFVIIQCGKNSCPDESYFTVNLMTIHDHNADIIQNWSSSTRLRRDEQLTEHDRIWWHFTPDSDLNYIGHEINHLFLRDGEEWFYNN